MKVLLIGESWSIHMTHSKGFDSFTSTKYEEGATFLISQLRSRDIEVDYFPAHQIQLGFDLDLNNYDVVIISDIGSNTFLLQNNTFYNLKTVPNALVKIKDYVANGGGFMMIGGYLSFMGIEAKANYKNTILNEVFPVEMLDGDDRVEVPEGIRASYVNPEHETVKGFEGVPLFLGYNRVKAREGSEVVMAVGDDPLLVFGSYKQGKTACFMSDCSPHWGCNEFMNWKHYTDMWVNSLKHIAKK